MEQVVDLGDTQVFSDAKDVYPAIVVASKSRPTSDATVRSYRFRRGDRTEDLAELIATSESLVPTAELSDEGWQFDDPAIMSLRQKLFRNGQPLSSIVEDRFFLGIKTGLNEAFVVTTAVKDKLAEDGRSGTILKPFIGGQNVRRWIAEDSGNWLILIPSGTTSREAGTTDPIAARAWLRRTYPAVEAHLAPYEGAATKRTDKGQFWWELRACDYYQLFESPKIIYPDIVKHSRFLLDTTGLYSNNTTYFIPSADSWLLGVLNSEALWFALSGVSIPFGERAGEYRYRMFTQYISRLPIPQPTDAARAEVESLVAKLIDQKAGRTAGVRAVLDWLRAEFGIDKPTQKLAALVDLSPEELIAEVKKIRGRKSTLSVAQVKRLRDEHAASVGPLQAGGREADRLERRVSDLVNAAFGLTAAEVALLWATAPPRMPISPLPGGGA